MEIYFDDRLPQTVREYEKYLTTRDIAKVERILSLITQHGIQSLPPKLGKHLWDDIYEIKPNDKRIIFVKATPKKGIVLKVYAKKSNKMPIPIKNSINNRLKIIT